MEPLEVAQAYFDEWNLQDPAEIAATFAPGGTYNDPTTGQPLSGQAIVEHTSGLFTAFPDLSFEIVSAGVTGDGTVGAQWLMRGTNSGSFGGGSPTGQTVELPGADFIVVDGDKIRSVQGYFGQRTLVEQLGLQVIVQPYSIGPISFGSSVYVNQGDCSKPGAFSITSISLHSDEEAQEVSGFGARILREMTQMPGFISAVIARAGLRMFTISAWEDVESPKQLLRGGAHKEAMDRVLGPDFATGFMTSVWVPDRINPMWVRCPHCDRMVVHSGKDEKCQCGQTLPENIPYW